MKIPLQGSIKDISLVKILVHLNRSIKTGTLTVSTPSAIKKIYLKMGDVIFASSTYEDDRLGEMLLKAGEITVEQYDESVRILKSTGKKQGAILVELGYLTPKELFLGLKYQVNEIIQGMFLLEDAQYEFKEGEIPAQEVISLKMSMVNLIYAGINRITSWTKIRNEMPDIDSGLKLSEDSLSLSQDIELSPQDKKILSLIDGGKTIKEIIDNSWMGAFEALRILYVFLSLGMIEQAAVQKEALKPAKTRGNPKGVRLNELLEPFSEEESQISKINSLASPKKETGPRGGGMAEDLLKKGVKELKKGNFQGAIDNFTSAIKLKPDNTSYLSYLSLAYSKVPGKIKDAEAMLLKAIKLEPLNADLHANLGLIYIKAGLMKKAQSSFQKALKIDPQHAKAKKWLEQTKA